MPNEHFVFSNHEHNVSPLRQQGYLDISREKGLAFRCVHLRRSQQRPLSRGAPGVESHLTLDQLLGHQRC